MIIASDIGNTNISIGIFKKDKLCFKYDIPTKKTGEYKFLLNKLLRAKKIQAGQIEAAVICGVVPSAQKILAKTLREIITTGKIYITGKDFLIPVKNLYRKPEQVGQDRLINAYAGIMLYGAPLIIIDFGTAITFDVVSKNKEYLGGMIIPGMDISLDALYRHTALLPKIKLREPKELIGRDTAASMLSGVVYGFSALTEAISGEIRKKIGHNPKVIGTGGNIHLIKKYCKNIDIIDNELTLKGLYLLYNSKNRE